MRLALIIFKALLLPLGVKTLPNVLRHIFLDTVLAFGRATALGSHAANYVNWERLKSKVAFTPIACESRQSFKEVDQREVGALSKC